MLALSLLMVRVQYIRKDAVHWRVFSAAVVPSVNHLDVFSTLEGVHYTGGVSFPGARGGT